MNHEERGLLHGIYEHLKKLTRIAEDQVAFLDRLTQSVTNIEADVAKLLSAPPPPPPGPTPEDVAAVDAIADRVDALDARVIAATPPTP